MHKWGLKELLDYETGDSWNGTHHRDIYVSFNAASQKVKVTSANQMFDNQEVSAEFSLDEVRKRIASGELQGARYYNDFIRSAAGRLPAAKPGLDP